MYMLYNISVFFNINMANFEEGKFLSIYFYF